MAGAHHDLAGGVVAERDASAVDLANDGRAAGYFFNGGGLTKSELPHPLAKGALPLEFHYHAHGTGGKLAQGKQGMGGWIRHGRGTIRLRLSFNVNAHRPDPGTKKRTLERMRF